jgi:hypothetical protein
MIAYLGRDVQQIVHICGLKERERERERAKRPQCQVFNFLPIYAQIESTTPYRIHHCLHSVLYMRACVFRLPEGSERDIHENGDDAGAPTSKATWAPNDGDDVGGRIHIHSEN